MVFIGMAILILLIARVVPGDSARIALVPLASAGQVAEMRTEIGPVKSFVEQSWGDLSGLVQGDPGKLLLSGHPVPSDLAQVLPATERLDSSIDYTQNPTGLLLINTTLQGNSTVWSVSP